MLCEEMSDYNVRMIQGTDEFLIESVKGKITVTVNGQNMAQEPGPGTVEELATAIKRAEEAESMIADLEHYWEQSQDREADLKEVLTEVRADLATALARNAELESQLERAEAKLRNEIAQTRENLLDRTSAEAIWGKFK